MRAILQTLGWFLLIAALVVAGAILWALWSLPPLHGAADVRHSLAQRIEAERTFRAIEARDPSRPVRFEVTPRGELMGFFVQSVVSAHFCPDYFEAPPMPLPARALQMVRRALSGRPPEALGARRCQIVFARSIVQSIGLPPDWKRSVAEFQVLSALGPDELFELYLSSLHYDLGVFGPQEASQALFHRPIEQLNISQMTALIASQKNFGDWLGCREPLRLQVQRDRLLDRLEALNVVSKAAAQWVRDEDWACPKRARAGKR